MTDFNTATLDKNLTDIECGGCIEKLRERCQIALWSTPRPDLEAVLEESAMQGVLYGSVNTLFRKWELYVRHVVEAVPKALSLPSDVTALFKEFVNGLVPLLGEAEQQSREGLVKICRAVERGYAEVRRRTKSTFHICADKSCVYVNISNGHPIFSILLHDISANLYFPDIGLSSEELEAFQLGWRASDEGVEKNRPMMKLVHAWQLFAWLATRPGEVRLQPYSLQITTRGLSLAIYVVAKDWTQKWDKEKAQRLALEAYQRGDYRPLLTWWLGDGVVDKRLRYFQLSIGAKYAKKVLRAFNGKYHMNAGYLRLYGRKVQELTRSMIIAAGTYGQLLEALHSHKWRSLKASSALPRRDPFYILIRGVEMYLYLHKNTLVAETSLKDGEVARHVAEILKPYANITKSGNYYKVRIGWNAIKKLAEEDSAVKKAIIQFLERKAGEKTCAKRLLAQLGPVFPPPLL